MDVIGEIHVIGLARGRLTECDATKVLGNAKDAPSTSVELLADVKGVYEGRVV